MDYMEQSTIHIKAPHEIHIGAKVMAAKRRTSMNQYVIDLIDADLNNHQMDRVEITQGINAARSATPEQKKIIKKAIKVFDEMALDPTKGKVDIRFCKHNQVRGLCKKGCK